MVNCSPFLLSFVSAILTLVTTEESEAADDDDDTEEIDDAEWLRCGPLRGSTMRDTSSALIEFSAPAGPLPAEFHPRRGRDGRLGGDATAVMRRGI